MAYGRQNRAIKGAIDFSTVFNTDFGDQLVIIAPVTRKQHAILLAAIESLYWATRWAIPADNYDSNYDLVTSTVGNLEQRLSDFMFWNDVIEKLENGNILLGEIRDAINGVVVPDTSDELDGIKQALLQFFGQALFETATIALNNNVQETANLVTAVNNIPTYDQSEQDIVLGALAQIANSLSGIDTNTLELSNLSYLDQLSALTHLEKMECVCEQLALINSKDPSSTIDTYLPILTKDANVTVDAHRCRQASRAVGLLVELHTAIPKELAKIETGLSSYISIVAVLAPIATIFRAFAIGIADFLLTDIDALLFRDVTDINLFIAKFKLLSPTITGYLYKSGNVQDFLDLLNSDATFSSWSDWERNAISIHTDVFNDFHSGKLEDGTYKTHLKRDTDPAALVSADCVSFHPNLTIYDHSAYPAFIVTYGTPPTAYASEPASGLWGSELDGGGTRSVVIIEMIERYEVDYSVTSFSGNDLIVTFRDFQNQSWLDQDTGLTQGASGTLKGSQLTIESDTQPFTVDLTFKVYPITKEFV